MLLKRHIGAIRIALLVVSFFLANNLFAEEVELGWDPLSILGSKHDLTSLNKRAGTDAMEGVAYTNYGNACVYCHITPEQDGALTVADQIEGWNRIRPASEGYRLYESSTFKSKAQIPNDITMLCLSCHDGTMAVDRIVNTPRAWKSGDEMTMHMRLNASGDLNSCGLCHDSFTAYGIGDKHIGTDMRRNHPVSIRYPGLDVGVNSSIEMKFRTPVNEEGFANGVRLFNGFVECASCHDVHNPSNYKLLRTNGEKLCVTCHRN